MHQAAQRRAGRSAQAGADADRRGRNRCGHLSVDVLTERCGRAGNVAIQAKVDVRARCTGANAQLAFKAAQDDPAIVRGVAHLQHARRGIRPQHVGVGGAWLRGTAHQRAKREQLVVQVCAKRRTRLVRDVEVCLSH